MNSILKTWPAAVAGGVLTVLALIVLFAAGHGDNTHVKPLLWLVALLPVIIGVVVDLMRQKKINLPS
jgi:hypothetical protein